MLLFLLGLRGEKGCSVKDVVNEGGEAEKKKREVFSEGII